MLKRFYIIILLINNNMAFILDAGCWMLGFI